jgi:hypothetical protein
LPPNVDMSRVIPCTTGPMRRRRRNGRHLSKPGNPEAQTNEAVHRDVDGLDANFRI